jgi:hypothetical protein
MRRAAAAPVPITSAAPGPGGNHARVSATSKFAAFLNTRTAKYRCLRPALACAAVTSAPFASVRPRQWASSVAATHCIVSSSTRSHSLRLSSVGYARA